MLKENLFYVTPGFVTDFITIVNRDLARNLQLRNVHIPSANRLTPLTILFQHLAKAANMSLHPLQIKDFDTLSDLNNSYMNPFVYTWSKTSIGNPIYLRNISKQLHAPNPILVGWDSLPYNHVYCSENLYIVQSDWDYSLFTKCFDYYTNCCIILAILIVNWLQGEASALLSAPNLLRLLEYPYFGFSNGFEKRKSSALLSMGLMGYTVLNVYYTGVLTSLVTRPMKLNTFDDLGDLLKNGFSLAHGSKSVKQQLEGNAKTFNIEYLAKLISRKPTVIADNVTSLEEILANGNRVAYVGIWPVVFEMALKSKQILKQSGKSSKRDCHVGKQLIGSMINFYGFVGKNNKRLGKLFARFIDGGIERLYRREDIGLSIARRIQDRVRFKGPNKDPLESHPDPESLSMKNLKILTIFHYFGILLIICSLVFASEWFLTFAKN